MHTSSGSQLGALIRCSSSTERPCTNVAVRDGQPIGIDKTVAVVTCRDRAIATPALGALDQLARSPAGVAGLLPGHRAAWGRLWSRFGVDLDADRDTQLVLNLHIFYLLQAISPHLLGSM